MILQLYFASHPVFLCTNFDEILEEKSEQNDAIFLRDLSHESLSTCWQLLDKPGDYPCFFLYHDLEKLLETLLAPAKTIEAGGGVVYNDDNDILLIFRRGKWDLPKGKLDPGESLIDCALREVIEETGLKNLTLIGKIGSSSYCYKEKDQLYLKQVQWFKMRTSDKHTLTPQIEEDISELRWVSQKDLEPYIQNTYSTIKDILLLAQRSPDSIG